VHAHKRKRAHVSDHAVVFNRLEGHTKDDSLVVFHFMPWGPRRLRQT
jgi:hypothetical protein